MSALSTITAGRQAEQGVQVAQVPHGTLRRALRLLGVSRRQVAASITVGTLALGSAIALAAVSAWLIARASQMPPVMTLSVAAVAVRTFGISRGVLRYVERLISHDLALRGMTTLRTTVYARLADGKAEAVLRVRRGDLLARVGADVDAVGDLVVRGLVPAGVALALGVGTSLAMGLFWPPAGVALALCLVVAGVVAPALTSRGVRTAESRASDARARMTATALGILDDAGPLAVAGRTDAELAGLARQDARIAAAVDAGARPTALAAGLGVLAQGVAVLVALVTGIPAVRSGLLAPVELAVVVLTPLAAFEATSVLPTAAVQVQRSRAAAARILALLDSTGTPDTGAVVVPEQAPSAPVSHVPLPRPLVARSVACGWSDGPAVLTGVDLELTVGRSLAVVGPSGVGKTTLLLTLAGLLPPKDGQVLLAGVPMSDLPRPDVVRTVVATTEDAHVFGTTVLENLRVARGDVTPEQAHLALARVGLGDWVAQLPDGLDTLLGPDARTVSGGERRRLLLARALLADSPLLLLDEPGEHLDPASADRLVADLLRDHEGRGVLVVTHRLAPLAAADEVLWIEDGRVAARGTHEELLARVPGYASAAHQERTEGEEAE